MADVEDHLLNQRKAVFEALTGRRGSQVTGAANDIRGMLSTVYGVVKDGEIHVDTKKAARYMKVSQRTIQRWLKAQNAPSKDHLKTLQKRSRQAATTKRGRARAVRQAAQVAQATKKGVRVEVSGMQGPRDYPRDRGSRLELDPEEYQAMLDAYAEGGDAGALGFLAGVYDQKYVADWEFNAVNGFRVSGLSPAERADPRAL